MKYLLGVYSKETEILDPLSTIQESSSTILSLGRTSIFLMAQYPSLEPVKSVQFYVIIYFVANTHDNILEVKP